MSTKEKTEIADTELGPVEGMEDYDAAFDEASVVVPEELSAAPKEEEEEPAVEPPVEETPPAVETAPPAEEPPASVPADTQALENRIAELEQSLTQAAKQPAPSDPPAAIPVELSTEDQEVISEVEEDWPTIHRAQEIRIKQLEARLMQALQEAVGGVKEEMQPFVKVSTDTAQDKFMNSILAVHEDAKTILPQVEKWIDSQPTYLRPALNNVLDRGSAQDVIELYTQYKTAAGITSAQTPPADTPPADDRLSHMEGVRTTRTSLTVEDDPSDFDGAFDRAASTVN